MGLREKLNAVKESLDEARKAQVEAGKKIIKEILTEFFAAHPEAKALRWDQYTPYFNDGDACIFHVRGLYVQVDGGDPEGGEQEDGFLDTYDIAKSHPELKDDLNALEVAFGKAEDALEELFGDHVTVTVPRDGEAEVEECSHD